MGISGPLACLEGLEHLGQGLGALEVPAGFVA